MARRIAALAVCLIVLTFGLLYAVSSTGQPGVATMTLGERFGKWAFVTLIPSLEPLRDPNGVSLGLGAENCGACHQAVYDEWSQSTHATALQDIQYLAELSKKDSPKWLCLNCHIPLQDQREYLVAEDTRLEDRGDDIRFLVKEPNPNFDPALQRESITCASCHVRRDGAGRSYVIAPKTNGRAPHPVEVDRDFLHATCKRCHNPGLAQLTVTFVCWFDTVEELAAGPYAGKKDCVDCHMPETTRALVEGLPPRRTHQHHWAGGGVPKSFEAYDRLLDRDYKPGLGLKVLELGELVAGQTAPVTIDYENAHAGHWLTTADPERFILLDVSLEDASGRSTFRERFKVGQKWDWGDVRAGRVATRLRDNRLRPLEKRTWVTEVPLPDDLSGARLVVTALHVRLTAENAGYMKKTAGLESSARYREDLVEQIANLEENYPFFTYVAREVIDLDSRNRRRFTLDELMKMSQDGRNLSLDELATLLKAPEIP